MKPRKISFKEKPLVSVIIPCFNHESFIKEAVESVLYQTYKTLELIIIDDGSEDRSAEIIEGISDNRIVFIKQKNRGAHNTINRGFSLAKGKYIAILNSDDVYHPDRLRQSVTRLEHNRELLLVCSYIECIDTYGNSLWVREGWKNMEPWRLMAPKRIVNVSTNDFAKNLLISNFIVSTSNMVFRKEIIKQIGGMRNLRFAHDWDFALRVAEAGKCALIKKPLIQYRLHIGNTLNSDRTHLMFENCWVYAVHLEKYEQNILFSNNSTSDMHLLMESIDLQGNDKLVWAIRSYLSAMKLKGIKDAELFLLDDRALRESLFKYIHLDSSSRWSRWLQKYLKRSEQDQAYSWK